MLYIGVVFTKGKLLSCEANCLELHIAATAICDPWLCMVVVLCLLQLFTSHLCYQKLGLQPTNIQELVPAHYLQIQAVDANGVDIGSDDEVAVGHDGRLRIVLSDVTSRFPTEQLPQQVPEDVITKPAEAANSFQLQRRGGQGRLCRNLLAGDSDTPCDSAPQGGSSMPADSNAQAAALVRPALRSSARLQADALTAPDPQASDSATSDGQSGICTRRQAKLNRRPSQQLPPQQTQQPQHDVASDDDFAVIGHSQRQAVNPAPSNVRATLEPSRSEATSGYAKTGMAEKPSAVRRNRPRLQLNRKPKGVGDMVAASQASTSTTSQH